MAEAQIASSPRRPIYAALGIAGCMGLALLISACGGGGEKGATDTTLAAQATSTPAEGVSTILAIPPRAPTYQVINGITVPPEPAPTLNNATLAGVDINSNGVRDDVERVIARKTPANFVLGLTAGRFIQSVLTSSTPIDEPQRKIFFCALANRTLDEYSLMTTALNTQARELAFNERLGFEIVERCD